MIIALVSPFGGCVQDRTAAATATTITGKVVNERTGAVFSKVKLNVMDARSHPSFGLPTPTLIGTTVTTANGEFELTVPRKLQRAWFDVEFADISNFDAVQLGRRVVNVSCQVH